MQDEFESRAFSVPMPQAARDSGDARRPRPSITGLLTLHIVDTYSAMNHKFRLIDKLPQRILTNPSVPASSNSVDNVEANLICRVNDRLESPTCSFVILDLLGTGTFGQVFRCVREDGKDGRQLVAVKVVKSKPAYYSQGQLEIKIASYLNSKDPEDDRHIVRLQESFEYQGHVCLVFELLSMTLLDVLTQNQFRGLPLPVVQRFTRQILTALVLLEDCRIIHCDLKPENILLSQSKPQQSSKEKRKHEQPVSEGDSVRRESEDSEASGDKARRKVEVASEVKLIDFGSACFEGRTMYSYIQSRFYRSPEVLVGLPYNGAIDLWSLGCVCAEIYLGLPLFPGVSQHNQLTRIVEMLGSPPDSFVARGKNGLKYFCRATVSKKAPSFAPLDSKAGQTQATEAVSKYRLKTAEEYAAETSSEVPVLRKYLRYSRLEDVILKCPLANKSKLSAAHKTEEMRHRRCFLDYLTGLLRLDPADRWTARQAAGHPFVTGAAFNGPYLPADRGLRTATSESALASTPTKASTSPTHAQIRPSSLSNKPPSMMQHQASNPISPPSRQTAMMQQHDQQQKHHSSQAQNVPVNASDKGTPGRRRSSVSGYNLGSYASSSLPHAAYMQPPPAQYLPPTQPPYNAYSMGYAGSYGGAPQMSMSSSQYAPQYGAPPVPYDPRRIAYSASSQVDFGYSYQPPGSFTVGGAYGMGVHDKTRQQPYFFTDFGQALIRPDMNEHRRLMSQQEEASLYWQQQQGYASSQGSHSGSYMSPRFQAYPINNYPGSSYGAPGIPSGRQRQGSFTRNSFDGRERSMARYSSSSAAQDSVTELANRLDGAFEGIKGYSGKAVSFADGRQELSLSGHSGPKSLDDDLNADWEPFFAADDMDNSVNDSGHGGLAQMHANYASDDEEKEETVDDKAVGPPEVGKSLTQNYLLMQHQKFMHQHRSSNAGTD